jgi:hypothetical protein
LKFFVSKLAGRYGKKESMPKVARAGAGRTITMTSGAFGETGSLGRPQTILLMEDEAFVRKATAEVLESAGPAWRLREAMPRR